MLSRYNSPGMKAGRLRLSFLLLLAALAFTCQASNGYFVLTERLGHTWSNERVSFAVTPEVATAAAQKRALLGPGGGQVPYQLQQASGKGPARIHFQTSLAPYETRSYRFSDQSGNASELSDLEIHESAEELRIQNRLAGVSIRKTLKRGQGPISGIRLRSGLWTGDSSLARTSRIKDYKATVTATGPVFVEVECRLEFADGGYWNLRFRVENNEPVVLVEEQFDAPGAGVFRLRLGGEEFLPSHGLYRSGSGGNLGKVSATEFASHGQFTLEPWLHWWESDLQGNWFALYSPEDNLPDLLMLGVLKPAEWIDPDWQGKAEQADTKLSARTKDGWMNVAFPLGGGQRRWMLATPDKETSIQPLSEKQRKVAPLPQAFLVKHGDFPLDEVKDYVLDWPGDISHHPRLYFQPEEFLALRSSLVSNASELERWERRQPIDKYNIAGPLREYFASGSPQLGEKIVTTASSWLDSLVSNDLLLQNSRVTLGFAPHNQAVLFLPTLNLVDAALGVASLSADVRGQFRAKLAFLAYVVNSDHYWSPPRGFSANPNMSTTVALYQVLLAALIPSHPLAGQWAEKGLNTLQWQLHNWSDPDGGWLEAPHYAVVAYDHLLAAFIAASRAGFGDYLFDDRMRRVAEWLARISTPPDARTDGFRHLPPIGNTYYGESSGIFCIVAGVWEEQDPEFAAHMQWMCEQQGNAALGLGWSFPSMTGYSGLLRARNVTARQPAYGSKWFSETGVVLRNATGSGRETYLHLIAGENHEHYDHDSGSVIIWGKGSVLADDWGYIGRHAEKYHSVLSSMAIHGNMRITDFSTQQHFDYVSGQKLAWQRQIAFAKDENPLGANFFMIRDTHHFGVRAGWKLWVHESGEPGSIQIRDKRVTVAGPDDVDFDLFFHRQDELDLKTEPATQKMSVGRRNGKTGPMELTLTAITASTRKTGFVTVLIYPRLKSESPPKVTWHSEGQIAKVVSKDGQDFIFLSPQSSSGIKKFESGGNRLSFQGAAGSVRIRDNRARLSLGATGKITLGSESLESKTGKASKQVPFSPSY